jgi:hypothetical protein
MITVGPKNGNLTVKALPQRLPNACMDRRRELRYAMP